LPADKTPETVTLDEAVALIDARAERTGGAAPHARPRKAKRPSPGTARVVKASSKKPGAGKRPTTRKPPTEAAE
jgi:DNA topoisomerase-1